MKTIGKSSVASFLTILLEVGWYGTIAVLILTIVLAVSGSNVAVQIAPDGAPSIEAGPDVKMAIPVSFSVNAGVMNAQIQDGRGSLQFPLRRGALLVANTVVVAGMLGIALWVIDHLRAVFRTLRNGQPFVPANATRVRRIAWAVILGELARSAIVYFENNYAVTHFSVDGLHLNAWPHINVFAIVNGLILLVIAEVFRLGTRLDEEQSLTI